MALAPRPQKNPAYATATEPVGLENAFLVPEDMLEPSNAHYLRFLTMVI